MVFSTEKRLRVRTFKARTALEDLQYKAHVFEVTFTLCNAGDDTSLVIYDCEVESGSFAVTGPHGESVIWSAVCKLLQAKFTAECQEWKRLYGPAE